MYIYRPISLLAFLVIAQCLWAQSPCPCCEPEYRQFDFWLGEWVVYQNGTLAGKNTISLEQDSCILVEKWRSAKSDYTGTSINYYNATAETWQQTWVDNQGGHLVLSGGLNEKGQMELSSDTIDQPTSDKRIHTIRWTPREDGTVRQRWKVHLVDSDSTMVLFDGLYKRVQK